MLIFLVCMVPRTLKIQYLLSQVLDVLLPFQGVVSFGYPSCRQIFLCQQFTNIMFHCPNHYGDCLQSGLYSKSQYPSLAFLVKYIVGVRYFISILCVVSMIWFCVDGIKLDTRNNYFMGGKWEQSANVNQMCGYAKHVTHIISWRTIIKNNWLAKFSFHFFKF